MNILNMKLKKQKGIALITTLLFLVILFILATTLIGLMSNDYRFTKMQEQKNQTLQLAISGIDYAAGGGMANVPVNSNIQETDIYLPEDQDKQYCHITINTNPGVNTTICEGKIVERLPNNREKVIYSKKIEAPVGSSEWHEKFN